MPSFSKARDPNIPRYSITRAESRDELSPCSLVAPGKNIANEIEVIGLEVYYNTGRDSNLYCSELRLILLSALTYIGQPAKQYRSE